MRVLRRCSRAVWTATGWNELTPAGQAASLTAACARASVGAAESAAKCQSLAPSGFPEASTMEINRFPLCVGIAAAFLSGCSGSQTPVGASGAMPEVPSSSAKAGHCKAWMSAKGDSRNPWLYVADTLDSVIYVYELRKSGAIEIGEITEGLNGPFGEAVDSRGIFTSLTKTHPATL